jgi:hypothetical protein
VSADKANPASGVGRFSENNIAAAPVITVCRPSVRSITKHVHAVDLSMHFDWQL